MITYTLICLSDFVSCLIQDNLHTVIKILNYFTTKMQHGNHHNGHMDEFSFKQTFKTHTHTHKMKYN